MNENSSDRMKTKVARATSIHGGTGTDIPVRFGAYYICVYSPLNAWVVQYACDTYSLYGYRCVYRLMNFYLEFPRC